MSPYWETPTVAHRLAHDFAQFKPMGETIRFTVDLHEVGCGALLTLYLAALPAVNEHFNFAPQQPEDESRHDPGCAGQMYYADANPEMTGCESYGFEFDLFEGNVASMHSTAHGCVSGLRVPGSDVPTGFAPAADAYGRPATGSSGWFGRVDQGAYPDPNVALMHNRVCDGDGTGVGIAGTGVTRLGNGSYGWGAAYMINTMHPFDVAVRFDERPARSSASSWFRAAASGAPDWSYTTTLSQAGRSIHHTTTIEDAVSERPLFPKAGSYRVSFTEHGGQPVAEIDGIAYPLRSVGRGARPAVPLTFGADGATVRVRSRIGLGDTITLGGYTFSNNGRAAT